MKSWKNFPVIVLLAAVVVLITAGCKDDDPKPTTATIRGTVTFENVELWDTWKDSGEVQLTIFPEFSLDPVAGWGEVPDGFFGPGIPGGTYAVGAPLNSQNPLVFEYQQGIDQYTFEFEFSNVTGPVTFSAIAVGFRHDFIMDATLRTATLGVFWNNPDEVSHGIVIRPAIGAPPIFNYPAPAEVTINPGDVIDVSFKADFGFVETWY